MASIGIGLIGVGRHGERYARHILEDGPGLRLAGITRRDRELGRRQAETFGCPWFESYQELLASDAVDAAAVVVPPFLHPPIVEEAMRRERPLLLEKPAAITVEAGRTILDTVRRAGVPVMMAQTFRYNPVVRSALRERERLGSLHSLWISHRFEPSPLEWVDDPGRSGPGGILLHTGVHSFDLARYLTGREAVSAFCRAGRAGSVRLENHFSAVFEMESGVTVMVAGSRTSQGRSGALELIGSRGQFLGDPVRNTAIRVDAGGRVSLDVPGDVPTVRETLAEFAGALRDGTAMPIALEDGIQAVAMAEACRRSSETGGAVAVPRVD